MEEQIQEKKKFSIKEIYNRQYKLLNIIPFIILLLAVLQIGFQVAKTGDFMYKGVSLKGGLTITIEKNTNVIELQKFLKERFPSADISVRGVSSAGMQIGTIVEASDIEAEMLTSALEESLKITKENYSVEFMGSSLGASFFKETMIAVIIAFILMAVVVFFYFRMVIPSLAILLSAFSDIVETLAIVNLLGIRLTTAGIAAFLMLIGYSVDTDILLSVRLLKRKEGTAFERTLGAMKTGAMMSITTIIAVTIGIIFAESEIIKQIMTIVLIGLLVDFINTWIQNAGLLRWYLDRKEKKNQNVQH